MSSVYQIYRSTTIGLALDETLHEFGRRQMFTPRIVHYILNIFDYIINEKLSFSSNQDKKSCCLIFKGHLLSYRSCDQVWTLLFDSITLTSTMDSSWKITLIDKKQKVKIIACPTTNPPNRNVFSFQMKPSKRFKSTLEMNLHS
ncbi:unnamed protein product [Adineta ricciae]|uniref:Transcription initiation factor IIA subunit 2 n=1 Tax=Adineta ricciae TaxID=249248 RepID=A0A814JXI6_ADIRI|nr:unnamed protein product [Adineta ricciae]CAF1604120.1 unnamed protein product [Adineta ricciae]